MASSKIIQPKKRGVSPVKLTDKMLVFVQEYIIDFNVSRAAVAAGSVAKMGFTWLRHPLVQKALAKALHDRLERNHLTQDDVLHHLRTALFLDPAEWCERMPDGQTWRIKDLDEIPAEVRRCIKGLKYREKKRKITDDNGDSEVELIEAFWELTFMDKDQCEALAMKHHGLLIEKQEVKVEVGENLASCIKDAEKNRGNRVIDAEFIKQVAQQQKTLTVVPEDEN